MHNFEKLSSAKAGYYVGTYKKIENSPIMLIKQYAIKDLAQEKILLLQKNNRLECIVNAFEENNATKNIPIVQTNQCPKELRKFLNQYTRQYQQELHRYNISNITS